MSSEYDLRAAVVEILRTDHKIKEIIEWFKFSKTMAYDLWGVRQEGQGQFQV